MKPLSLSGRLIQLSLAGILPSQLLHLAFPARGYRSAFTVAAGSILLVGMTWLVLSRPKLALRLSSAVGAIGISFVLTWIFASSSLSLCSATSLFPHAVWVAAFAEETVFRFLIPEAIESVISPMGGRISRTMTAFFISQTLFVLAHVRIFGSPSDVQLFSQFFLGGTVFWFAARIHGVRFSSAVHASVNLQLLS